jgi:hypothetical protein
VVAELEAALALRRSGADPKALRRALRRIEEHKMLAAMALRCRTRECAGVTSWCNILRHAGLRLCDSGSL